MRVLFSCFFVFVCAICSANAADKLCSTEPAAGTRHVSWKSIVPQILCDQKEIWTFPVSSAIQDHPVSSFTVVGGTAALVTSDPYTARYFRNSTAFGRFNKILSGKNTAYAMEIFPAAFLGASLLGGDSYGQQTALLAGEAVLNCEILTNTMKGIDQRIRPINVTDGNYAGAWFKDTRSRFGGHGSFPSGHTIAAFSIATVFARRYGSNHKWVPYVAYAAAGLIGFSRVTLSSHYVSDVALGAGLGFTISRFVVLGRGAN